MAGEIWSEVGESSGGSCRMLDGLIENMFYDSPTWWMVF